jgi:L-seryl-tRNA(Ser) seleniumtransferase
VIETRRAGNGQARTKRHGAGEPATNRAASGEADGNALYRRLPQLGDLLESAAGRAWAESYPRDLVAGCARAAMDTIRAEIAAGRHTEASLDQRLEGWEAAVEAELAAALRPSLRRVINATGVILHTNLGRAPLGKAALARMAEVAGGYCNLELDLATGDRGWRDAHVEGLLCRVLAERMGRHAAEFAASHRVCLANNCAAAMLLALNSLAEGGEVVVSRGELVEIGGGFRIPDILRRSGAHLREVGTTNKTRVGDYAEAIGPATKLILRVHQSNFRMEGFTERPALGELVALGRSRGVAVFEDQGTGCVADLASFGMKGEGSLPESLRAEPDLVAASGDKLLGGPQCGVLMGRANVMEPIRRNPLLRALRVDKLTYAAMEGTLLAYLTGREMEIPAQRMMAMDAEAIRRRCERLADVLAGRALEAEVVPVRSMVGGGTTPGASLASFAVALSRRGSGAAELAASLRASDTPVIGRVSEERVLLDLRTVEEEMDGVLGRMLAGICAAERG